MIERLLPHYTPIGHCSRNRYKYTFQKMISAYHIETESKPQFTFPTNAVTWKGQGF